MCVIGAKAGYRVLRWVMKPRSVSPPVVEERRQILNMSAERDCPRPLGFQVSNKVNVPEPAYQRQVGQDQDGEATKMAGQEQERMRLGVYEDVGTVCKVRMKTVRGAHPRR